MALPNCVRRGTDNAQERALKAVTCSFALMRGQHRSKAEELWTLHTALNGRVNRKIGRIACSSL